MSQSLKGFLITCQKDYRLKEKNILVYARHLCNFRIDINDLFAPIN